MISYKFIHMAIFSSSDMVIVPDSVAVSPQLRSRSRPAAI